MLMNPPPPASYSPPSMSRQSVQPMANPGGQNPIGSSNTLGAGNMAQATPISSLPAMGSDQGMGASPPSAGQMPMGGVGPALGNPPFPHAAFNPQSSQMPNSNLLQLLGQR